MRDAWPVVGPVVLLGGPLTSGRAALRLPGTSKESAADSRTPPRGTAGPGAAGARTSCGGGGACTSRYARPEPARGSAPDRRRPWGARARPAPRLPRPDRARWSARGPGPAGRARGGPATAGPPRAGPARRRAGLRSPFRSSRQVRSRARCSAGGLPVVDTVPVVGPFTPGVAPAAWVLAALARAGTAASAVAVPPARVRTVRSSAASRQRNRDVFARGAPGCGVTAGGRCARATPSGGAARS